MEKIRLIARLDVKDQYVVKGIQLEGLRKLGDPNVLAKQYYEQGIDEIVYLDTVASLYDRNNLGDIVTRSTQDVFIPITVGGGIRSVEDVRKILEQGADKVAINTAAIKNPQLLQDVSTIFGAQCLVLSIQAKSMQEGRWEAFYDNGREPSGLDVIEWIKEAEKFGIGEVFLTSVDKDGLQKGMDQELIQEVCNITSVPVIAASGVGSAEDIVLAAKNGASAVAVGSILHYNKAAIGDLKNKVRSLGVEVRKL